jgi:CBS domain-containing protein
MIRVAGIMAHDPITLLPEQTVAEALALMIEHRIGSIPIVNGLNELLGIVTDFEMLRILHEQLG